MDDSPANLPTFRSDPTAKRRTRITVQRPNRLGQTLREARRENNLELEDLSEITNVRLSYLEALEAGRFADLPSEADGKNFVRLYARAVGLEPARALLLYAQERRSPAQSPATQAEPAGLGLPASGNASVHPRLGRFTRLLASLLLVAAAIWLALRAFDGALTPGQLTPAQTEPGQTQLAEPSQPAPSTTSTPAAPAMILLSLRTTPPGAEISIDGYRFGQSPVVDAPVRAGNRTLKVERGGYGTFERTLDLSRDRRLNITLFPRGVRPATVMGIRVEAPARAAAPAPQAAAQVVVTVSAEAWLEVYRGNTRGGERLVYETAQPGATYSFSAPVYIFSGNAGGVSVAKGDAPAQPLGTSGAVVGEAY